LFKIYFDVKLLMAGQNIYQLEIATNQVLLRREAAPPFWCSFGAFSSQRDLKEPNMAKQNRKRNLMILNS